MSITKKDSSARCAVAVGSALRARICEIIAKHGTGRGGVSITYIAWRAKSNRLACNAILRAMERRGEAGQYNSSHDRWGCQTWYLREPNVTPARRGK